MKKADAHLTQLLAAVGLTDAQINLMAFGSGVWKRLRKLRPADVLKHLCQEAIVGTVSYNDLAAAVAAHTGVEASRQAYAQHLTPGVVALLRALLEVAMQARITGVAEGLTVKGGLKTFRRILIQDSTVIQLPASLFGIYSGVKNGHVAVCNARIQVIYDLCAGRFIDFRIDPYSRNDVAATHDLIAEPGDLILRDRGYFVVAAVQRQAEAGATVINRYKNGTPLYDPTTGKQIDLLTLLSRQGKADMEVLVGSGQTLRGRLVAAPVSEEIANLRRMKAKRENKSPPSDQLLKLMSWTIMLTTVLETAVSFDHILRLYGLRWRIENIFKTWKSNFSFAKLHRVSDCQFRCLVLARLLVVTLLFRAAFTPLCHTVRKQTGKDLSLMKFMRYATRHLGQVARLGSKAPPAEVINALSRYCTYEKRKRATFMSLLDFLEVAVECGNS
jgi:hypothetical protein